MARCGGLRPVAGRWALVWPEPVAAPADGPGAWREPDRSPAGGPRGGATGASRRQTKPMQWQEPGRAPAYSPSVARTRALTGRSTLQWANRAIRRTWAPCGVAQATRRHMVPSVARTRALTGKIDLAVREPGHPPAPDPWCATNRALRRKTGPVWRSSGHAPADGPPGATRPGPLAGSPTPLQYGNQATRRQMAHRCGAARVISRRRARAIRTGNRLPQPSQVAPRPRTRARSSVIAQDCSLSGSGKIPVVILHPSHIHFESRPAGSGRRQ